MDRNFKGIWIPKEIWLAENLTLQEKVLLVEIDSLDNEETGCYASNNYFSKFFGMTPGRISQIINGLVEKGFISTQLIKEGKEIRQRIIRINKPPYPEVFNILNTYLENYKGGIKYFKEGYLENYKENNIELINKNNNIYRFHKPTLEELKEYIKEKNLNVDPQAFIDYYDSVGWKVGGKAPMKDWKATCRRWSRTNPKQEKPTWLNQKIEKEEYIDTELEEMLKEFK